MAKAISKKVVKEEEITVEEAIEQGFVPPIIHLDERKPEIVPEVVVEKVTPVVIAESPLEVKFKAELSQEEKIVAFIESRTGGDTVRLNEFLKSLYPLPQRNEPPLWLNQGTSKQIKVLLSKMQADGLISIVNNTHELLGKFYHAGEQQITQHRNLNNVEILAKK